MTAPIRAFIGYDKAEDDAWHVAASTMQKNTSAPVHITKLEQNWLRRVGLYRRHVFEADGQMYDTVDRLPFSTEFSYTRFLVPSLCQTGWALFCDSDFLWRGDVEKLMNLADDKYAVMVVKHQFSPPEMTKMRGQMQTRYKYKNWSSMMLFNCDHYQCQGLTPFTVNTRSGAYLQQFQWVDDLAIGSIPVEWNWLAGYSDSRVDPQAVHFTAGTPNMEGYGGAPYADEWLEAWAAL